MLQYERFQETVLAEGGSRAQEWKHLLPAIPLAHRLRFLKTLKEGFSIPACFDMVMLSQTMKEEDYDSFIQQAKASKLINDGKDEISQSAASKTM